MARCGCVATCACGVEVKDTICGDVPNEGGLNLAVSGSGSKGNPYIISGSIPISADANNTLTCHTNGLFAAGAQIIGDINNDGCVNTSVTESPDNVFTLESTIIINPDVDNVLGPNFPGSGDSGCTATGLKLSVEDVQDAVGQAIGPALAGNCLLYDDIGNEINVQIADTPTTNGIKCTAGGLEVIPSTDAGNTTTLGTDGNIYTPGAAVVGDVDNDNCVNVSVVEGPTGTFTVEGSLVIDPNGCNAATCGPAGLLVPQIDMVGVDTSCINIDVTELGGCPDVFQITANPILASDPCQGLLCRADGLFVFSDPTNLPGDAGTNAAGVTFGPANGNFTTPFGPIICSTINNPSPCRTLFITHNLGWQIDFGRTAGDFNVVLESSINGGPFGTPSLQAGTLAAETGTTRQRATAYRSGTIAVIPPGGSTQVCVRASAIGAGAVNGVVTQLAFDSTLSGRWQQG